MDAEGGTGLGKAFVSGAQNQHEKADFSVVRNVCTIGSRVLFIVVMTYGLNITHGIISLSDLKTL